MPIRRTLRGFRVRWERSFCWFLSQPYLYYGSYRDVEKPSTRTVWETVNDFIKRYVYKSASTMRIIFLLLCIHELYSISWLFYLLFNKFGLSEFWSGDLLVKSVTPPAYWGRKINSLTSFNKLYRFIFNILWHYYLYLSTTREY